MSSDNIETITLDSTSSEDMTIQENNLEKINRVN